ncbi:unnamed protein product [Schistosoma mattheei]|uniref:Uncharacterized protein n=1 Tax=Schistosoma mattheei TaxID=31246 RepID=A0A183PYU0_9TREM|nr:unnamed protein product [Schistosoma mattheei]
MLEHYLKTPHPELLQSPELAYKYLTSINSRDLAKIITLDYPSLANCVVDNTTTSTPTVSHPTLPIVNNSSPQTAQQTAHRLVNKIVEHLENHLKLQYLIPYVLNWLLIIITPVSARPLVIIFNVISSSCSIRDNNRVLTSASVKDCNPKTNNKSLNWSLDNAFYLKRSARKLFLFAYIGDLYRLWLKNGLINAEEFNLTINLLGGVPKEHLLNSVQDAYDYLLKESTYLIQSQNPTSLWWSSSTLSEGRKCLNNLADSTLSWHTKLSMACQGKCVYMFEDF